jgi:hypothetical protein
MATAAAGQRETVAPTEAWVLLLSRWGESKHEKYGIHMDLYGSSDDFMGFHREFMGFYWGRIWS